MPFKHFVTGVEPRSTAHTAYKKYVQLHRLAYEALVASGNSSRDYNVVLSESWIAVIPRRTAGPGGPFGANALGMLGIVVVKDEEERAWWARLGYTKYLKQLGIPHDVQS